MVLTLAFGDRKKSRPRKYSLYHCEDLRFPEPHRGVYIYDPCTPKERWKAQKLSEWLAQYTVTIKSPTRWQKRANIQDFPLLPPPHACPTEILGHICKKIDTQQGPYWGTTLLRLNQQRRIYTCKVWPRFDIKCNQLEVHGEFPGSKHVYL